jgi:DNA-directed RNA polymerase specialized sigma24 family protein
VEDARIIRQLLAGDRDAFRHLVRKYMNAVYAMLARLTGNREEARGFAQECFIREYRNLQFDPARSFDAWLFQIARNVCVDQWRKKKENMAPLPGNGRGRKENTGTDCGGKRGAGGGGRGPGGT